MCVGVFTPNFFKSFNYDFYCLFLVRAYNVYDINTLFYQNFLYGLAYGQYLF